MKVRTTYTCYNDVKVVGVNAGYTLLHQETCSSPAHAKVSREAHSSRDVLSAAAIVKEDFASWEP